MDILMSSSEMVSVGLEIDLILRIDDDDDEKGLLVSTERFL